MELALFTAFSNFTKHFVWHILVKFEMLETLGFILLCYFVICFEWSYLCILVIVSILTECPEQVISLKREFTGHSVL